MSVMNPTRTSSSQGGRVIVLLIALLAAAMWARPAHAQGLPFVPEPVSTPELMGFADLLDLSDEQRLAILPIHDRYMSQYEQFAERDVQELLDRMVEIGRSFSFGNFSIPEREKLEAVLEQFDRVVNRAEQIDRQFFQQLASVLTDDQRRSLERARELRELKIIHDLVRQMTNDLNRGAGADLGAMVRRLPLNEQERRQVEPVLLSHERAYLREAKEAYGVLKDAAQYAIDSIDALGLRDMPPQELFLMAQQNPEFLERAEARFNEGSKPVQAQSHEMSQLNLQTLRRIAPMLRPELHDDLRDRFHRAAYRGPYQGLGEWRQRYRRALDLEALSSSQREAVRAQFDTHRRQDDAFIDDIVDLAEKRREYRSFRAFTQREAGDIEEQIETLQERRSRVAEAANSALNSLLTPALIAKIDDPELDRNRAASESGIMGGAVASGGGGGGAAADAEAEVEEAEREARRQQREIQGRFGGVDTYLPVWISRAELRRLSSALDWEQDPGKQTLLRTVYTDYRDAYEAAYENAETVLDAEEENEGDDEQATARSLQDRRDELVAELLALDERFFDDLSLLAGSEDEERIIDAAKRLHERQRQGEIAQSMSSGFGEEEAYVDLLAVILEQPNPAELLRVLSEPLVTYEQQMNTLYDERNDRSETTRKRWRTVQRINEQGGGLMTGRMAETAMDRWREARSEVNKTNGRIRTVNRQTLQQMMDQLSDDAAWELRYGYNRIAFPEIFEDGSSAEDDFEQVRTLPDLTPGQRESVNSIALDYRSRYFELSEQMVELRMAQDLDIQPFQMPEPETIQQFIELARLEEKREEVNHRARLRLRLLLTESQLDRLPDLRRQTTEPV